MASQPVKRQMVAHLATLADPESLDLPPSADPDTLALAYLCAYLESGGRISSLCRTLNVSRFLLSRWIKGNPERETQVLRARALGADALVDEGGDLLDGATRDTIAVANARAGWRRWLAGKYDPQTYGEGQAQPTSSPLHLHYHAALAQPPRLQAPTPAIPTEPPRLGSHRDGAETGYPTGSGTASETGSAAGGGRVEVGTLPTGMRGE